MPFGWHPQRLLEFRKPIVEARRFLAIIVDQCDPFFNRSLHSAFPLFASLLCCSMFPLIVSLHNVDLEGALLVEHGLRYRDVLHLTFSESCHKQTNRPAP